MEPQHLVNCHCARLQIGFNCLTTAKLLNAPEIAPVDSRVDCAGAGVSEPQIAQSRFGYVPAIDGLRAVSILMVIAFHCGGPVSKALFPNGGWLGVDVFFVISGYLITSILLNEQKRKDDISLKNFYMRRALRLMPVFAAFLAANYFFYQGQKDTLAGVVIAGLYMADYDLALGWLKTMGIPARVSWSLAVEEKFYLLWPSVLKFVRLRVSGLARVALSAIALCLGWKAYLIVSGASWLRLTGAFDTKIDVIMIGCLAAIFAQSAACSEIIRRVLGSRFVPLLLFAALLIIPRIVVHPSNLPSPAAAVLFWDLSMPLYAMLAACVILSLQVQSQSLVSKFLSTPLMTWLGRLSYSLYLWHAFAFGIVAFAIQQKFVNTTLFEPAIYAVSIAMAASSYYLIEKPCLNLKSKLSAR